MSPDLHAFQQDDVSRALPHAIGPEKSILSTMLKDPMEFIGMAIEEGLTPGHFYLPAHTTLYAFIQEMFAAAEEIELVTMVQRLIDTGRLDRIGGPSALTDLYTYAPTSGQFKRHLKHVKDKFVLRSIIQNANEAIEQAYDAPEEVAELLDSTEAAFLSIRNATTEIKEQTLRETIDECLEDMRRGFEGEGEVMGLSSGFSGMDNLGVTLKPGEMFVIAARPSMGKTSLMMNIVERVALDSGHRGMVFSIEVTRKQLVQNFINARAKFDARKVSRGIKPDKGDLQRIQRAAIEIASSKIIINDMSGISVGQLRAIARRRHREQPLQWIAIDYLQLMKATSKQAEGSREREVAEISAGIKGLAKELAIPIIILAQLNRGPEARTGKSLGKPRLSDLRESGALEQDADVVGLLYREAYYAVDAEAKAASAGRAQLDIAKNRNGPTGIVPLTFIAELMRFEDGEPVMEQPDLPTTTRSRHDY